MYDRYQEETFKILYTRPHLEAYFQLQAYGQEQGLAGNEQRTCVSTTA
jgi:hypothetical protein